MAKMNDDLNSNQGQNTFTSSNIECEKLRLSDSISEYDRQRCDIPMSRFAYNVSNTMTSK